MNVWLSARVRKEKKKLTTKKLKQTVEQGHWTVMPTSRKKKWRQEAKESQTDARLAWFGLADRELKEAEGVAGYVRLTVTLNTNLTNIKRNKKSKGASTHGCRNKTKQRATACDTKKWQQTRIPVGCWRRILFFFFFALPSYWHLLGFFYYSCS